MSTRHYSGEASSNATTEEGKKRKELEIEGGNDRVDGEAIAGSEEWVSKLKIKEAEVVDLTVCIISVVCAIVIEDS